MSHEDNEVLSEYLLWLSNIVSHSTNSNKTKTLERWENAQCYKQRAFEKKISRARTWSTARSGTCKSRSWNQGTCCCWVFLCSMCKTTDVGGLFYNLFGKFCDINKFEELETVTASLYLVLVQQEITKCFHKDREIKQNGRNCDPVTAMTFSRRIYQGFSSPNLLRQTHKTCQDRAEYLQRWIELFVIAESLL